jgi:hypothetical protein
MLRSVLTEERRNEIQTRARAAIDQATLRKDTWWAPPFGTFLVLFGFVVYASWAAIFGQDHHYAEPYLSPMYSPCIATACDHVTFGPIVGDWWPLSPAILILVFPLSFRLTCYYYRKAYYRSFWLSPVACGVREPRRRYTGETRFPLILQNIHRYTFYIAALYPLILFYDALLGTQFPGGFGVGVGTFVLLTNSILLGIYTFSCHSCRHLFGGHVDTFSGARRRHALWRGVSKMNYRHGEWAWVSLVWVAFTDLYVRLVSAGVIPDYHIVF